MVSIWPWECLNNSSTFILLELLLTLNFCTPLLATEDSRLLAFPLFSPCQAASRECQAAAGARVLKSDSQVRVSATEVSPSRNYFAAVIERDRSLARSLAGSVCAPLFAFIQRWPMTQVLGWCPPGQANIYIYVQLQHIAHTHTPLGHRRQYYFFSRHSVFVWKSAQYLGQTWCIMYSHFLLDACRAVMNSLVSCVFPQSWRLFQRCSIVCMHKIKALRRKCMWRWLTGALHLRGREIA